LIVAGRSKWTLCLPLFGGIVNQIGDLPDSTQNNSGGQACAGRNPIAIAPSIANELTIAAEAKGLTFVMVHNYLFSPEYQQIKNLIYSDTVGELRMVTIAQSRSHRPSWAAEYNRLAAYYQAGGVSMG
jgi:hypothetical protein